MKIKRFNEDIDWDINKKKNLNMLKKFYEYNENDLDWEEEDDESKKSKSPARERDQYDYEGHAYLNPITLKEVKRKIKEILIEDYNLGEDVFENEEVNAWLEDIAKQRMFSYWEDLSYFTDNHEAEIDEFLSLINY
jgi:hypothetical protein